jgi:hypothetical protein
LDATLFLADAAQVAPDGKLHALGIGWQATSSPVAAPASVAFILHVPWDETNRKIKWTLDLLSGDGKPVVIQTGSDSFSNIHMENEIEVGRPPGIKQGSSINVPFAVNVGPLPLSANSTFEWVLRVRDKQWRVAFSTRAAQQA